MSCFRKGVMSPLDPSPLRPLAPRRRGGRELISAELSAALSREWCRRALTAHEQAASFARFSLELLELGAPAALARSAARAVEGEIELARACATLASEAYGAPPPRPGPKRAVGYEETDLARITLGLVSRGCIGATVSSVQSREELEHCQHQDTREVLLSQRQIRAGEAGLSFRFLAWAARRADRELSDRIRIAFVHELGEHGERLTLTEWDRQLLKRGMLSEPRALALRQHVLRTAVMPCMESALSRDVRLG